MCVSGGAWNLLMCRHVSVYIMDTHKENSWNMHNYVCPWCIFCTVW